MASGSETPSATGAGAASGVRAYLLGQFVVVVGGRAIADDAWPRRKARQLFKYLLTRPRRRATRDEAVDLLWPDSDPEAAATNLRSAVYTIRRTLAAGELIVLDRDTVGLRAGGEFWTDADAFERAVAEAAAAADPSPLLEYADTLYTGDYLPDDLYEDWAAERREFLKRAWVALQKRLAREHEARGESERAATALRRLLAADPCDEDAAFELMRLLGRQGRRSDARRVYQQIVRSLRDELGAEPSPATVALERQFGEAAPASEEPVRLEQPVGVPAAPAPATSLPSAEVASPPHNLPVERTTFVNREGEQAAARELLLRGDVALVTLTGPGGAGKTRLAIQIVAGLVDAFADGICFVALAPILDAGLAGC